MSKKDKKGKKKDKADRDRDREKDRMDREKKRDSSDEKVLKQRNAKVDSEAEDFDEKKEKARQRRLDLAKERRRKKKIEDQEKKVQLERHNAIQAAKQQHIQQNKAKQPPETSETPAKADGGGSPVDTNKQLGSAITATGGITANTLDIKTTNYMKAYLPLETIKNVSSSGGASGSESNLFYGSIQLQNFGVKKRLIKKYQASKVRKWDNRWVFHPSSACGLGLTGMQSKNNTVDVPVGYSRDELWLRKWVSQHNFHKKISINSVDELSQDQLRLLKMLTSNEGCQYSGHDFYKNKYLEAISAQYDCEVPGCGKQYTDLVSLRGHLVEKHGTEALGYLKAGDSEISTSAATPIKPTY